MTAAAANVRTVSLVLIVDDEPDAMLSMRIDLEAAGHQTVLAADADTAMKRLSAYAVELVLIDMMMPVWDGWTVLEALQRQPSRPPTIVVSGRAGPADLERAQRLGTVGYLHKPVSPADLDRAMDRALGFS